MKLLAALAAISTFAVFAVVTTPAHAQYPPPSFSLVCETETQVFVESGENMVSVTVFDASGATVAGVSVTFVADPGGPFAVESTDANGVATADVSGLTPPFTVTASLEDTSSCETELEEVLSSTIEEVANLPATGSGGAPSGSAMPFALIAVGVLAFVALVGRRAMSSR